MAIITLLALTQFIVFTHCQDITVNLTQGLVQGHVVDTPSGPTVEFLGIPYAKPPIGDLRFMPPEPHDGWTGVLNATQYKAVCIQDETFVPPSLSMDEDCLFLNIFIPGDSIDSDRKEKFTVMVYLHAGAYIMGRAARYPGKTLAATEVDIVVTVDYRLNIFGFLTTGDDQIPGNMGLMDQILALKWVQENIGDFGGDRNNVTVFGKGNGGMSASILTISPHAKSMFNRVISQSGVEQNRILLTWEDVKEKELIQEFATPVNCSYGDDTGKTKQCLQSVELEKLKRVIDKWPNVPVVDGKNGVIPEQPSVLWAKGDFAPVDYMAGVMRDDGDILVWLFDEINYYRYLKDGISFEKASEQVLQLLMTDRLGYLQSSVPEAIPEDVKDLHRIVIDNYFLDPGNNSANLRALLDVMTENFYLAPSLHVVRDIHQLDKKSFLYYFTHKAQSNLEDTITDVGPFHHEDNPYVFGNYLDPATNASDEDINISKSIMRAWASFAKYG